MRESDRLRLAGIGRFQVMALLQAARHYLLYRDMEKAKSFVLNRAVFYAWAKHYGSSSNVQGRARWLEKIEKSVDKREGVQGSRVLGEVVEVSPRGFYVFGGEEQTPRDYDRQVTLRISKAIPYEKAWRAALEYLSKFPKEVLENPQRFFKEAYEPVRDDFFIKLLQGRKIEPKTGTSTRTSHTRPRERGRMTSLSEFIDKEKSN